MRITEKGYSVLVLEKGKRYKDKDFAKTNWQFWKYLWLPALRAHGILQVSILKGVMVLHGAGVGGGSRIGRQRYFQNCQLVLAKSLSW